MEVLIAIFFAIFVLVGITSVALRSQKSGKTGDSGGGDVGGSFLSSDGDGGGGGD
jgi:preprotein translocase subunit SecG